MCSTKVCVCLNVFCDLGEGWVQVQKKVVNEIGQSHAKNKGRVDYAAVEKLVVRSQPPRVEDVPETIAYIQKWGGGVDGKFIIDTHKFIHVATDTARHVSVSFFNWLTKLDVPLSNPDFDGFALFVQAMVKAHASGPELAEGQVCRHLSQNDVQSSIGKNKDSVKVALQYLKRCKVLLNEHNDITERDAILLSGEYEIKLVNLALKKTVPSAFDTFEKITKWFVTELGRVSGLTLTDAIMPHEVDHGSVVPNVVEYNSEGALVEGGRMTLLTKGFDVEKIVFKPQKDTIHQTYFKIIAIELDGNVELQPIVSTQSDKKTKVSNIKVPFIDFDGVYKVAAKSASLHPGWPECSVKSNVDMAGASMKGQLASALYALGFATHTEHLKVQDQPVKAVFAAKTFKANTLVIPPTTMQIALETNPTKDPPTKSVVVLTGRDSRRFFLTHTPAKDFVPPFWYIRSTSNIEEANTFLTDYSVDCVPPKLIDVMSRQRPEHVSFKIPCAMNKEDVSEGCELVLYRECKPVQEKEKKHSLAMEKPSGSKRVKKG